MRALACPASLKGVLRASEAAAALAEGFRRAGVEVEELPVADGGEGTLEALHRALGGEWRTAFVADPLGRPVEARWLVLPGGTAVVESAEPLGLPRLERHELDPLRASSRGLGELILAALGLGHPGQAPAARERPPQHHALVVCLGGVATVDGGVGLRSVVGEGLDGIELTVLCDVRAPLLGPRGAARAFGPQKGASPAAVEELERRLAADEALAPFAFRAGAGAAGGLGAALAALGGRLVEGAPHVLERIGLPERLRTVDLVVTGEGTVDRTTAEGKAPAAVARAAREAGVRCVVFGGRLLEPLPDVESRALSGDPRRAREDLAALAESLAARV